MEISASGLSAQRRRMDVIADNIANANTTRTPEGGPYLRRQAVFSARLQEAGPGGLSGASGPSGPSGPAVAGVAEPEIVTDPSPTMLVHNPGHPDADADGNVEMPNVSIVRVMVDMISATRAYEANVTAMNAAKSMALKALEIGRG